MEDKDKTKAQLINELVEMRCRVTKLEAAETERKRAEEKLKNSEEWLKILFEFAPDAYYLTDLKGNFIDGNKAAEETVGYKRSELIGKNFLRLKLLPSEQIPKAAALLAKTALGQPTGPDEFTLNRKDGSQVAVEIRTFPVKVKDQAVVLGIARDITERKQAAEQLLPDAFHDMLTGLPNRALFINHLKRSTGHAKRSKNYLLAVLFLDLDHFKVVNDSLGHLIGDRLLITIAHRLKTCIRPGDIVARLGGDEFAILLDDVEDVDEVRRIADQIHSEVAAPVNLNGHQRVTTCSIGITLSGDLPSGRFYDRAEDLLRDADTAMHQAKARGRMRHEIFEIGMRATVVALLELEADLRRAIEQQEFRVHYQPIVSVASGQITGVEALLRWQRPQRGLVFPVEFISLLEETGLIVSVGEWVLRTTCAQLKEWHAAGYTSLRLAVNISVRQFQEQSLPGLIEKVLVETGLAAEALELEITESTAMQNVDLSLTTLNELGATGVQISIDDFGTGFSSLDRLKRLPINTLKIDQSFVRDMASDADNAAIITAIIAMGHGLELKVIAEGVETEEQLAFLRAQQCDEIQGYLFGHPMPAKALTKLL
jgi:diguanylate cyclase (GGDEF)-like protein/PAS domain S-box-containing protein